MQDRYAGDVGDFFKLGLLRWLVAATRDAPPLRLGVIWYRVDDESHNGDGKHVAYLDPGRPHGNDLRALDPVLYERLGAVVRSGERSVRALVARGVLPPGSVSYERVLSFAGLAATDRASRIARRHRWLDDARVAVAGCDVVFVDPDNGLRRDDHRIGSYRNRAEKHAYLSEVGGVLSQGSSVVAYHHADRSAPVPDQAQRRMDDIAEALGVEPLAAVRASRGTTRLFLVIPAADRRDHLDDRLFALERSPWAQELGVYRWAGSTRGVAAGVPSVEV